MCLYFIIAVIIIIFAKKSCMGITKIDFSQIVSWSKKNWHWLCIGRELFGGASVIIFSIIICWISDWNSKVFIIVGCALQIAGVSQAITSLLEIRRYFNHPPLLNIIKQWFKSYPEKTKKKTGSCCSLSITITPSKSEKNKLSAIDQAKPLNEKIDLLISNMEQIKDIFFPELLRDINQLKNKTDKLSTDMKKEIKEKTATIYKGVEQLHLDDFTLTLIGLVWIGAGTIMGAIGSLL
jgi:hypothetical protein